ncbi:DUF3574 domain-containing protein [Lysobacter brunescens]|uniref:DUF3574 domain-containing protein n=1 Tax=Lysobacter brunescens TaxID=262323 RepID=A0ABW2YDS3_9GAMM
MRRSCAATIGTLLCAMAFAMAGCRSVPVAGAATAGCDPGDVAMTRDILYFGRHRPDGGTVDDAQWRTFVDDVLTPRFPDGLTIVSGTGQWRGGDGAIEREPSEVVTILHTGDATARRAIEEVIVEYKRRFAQESVLRERGTTCVRF